MSSEYSEKDTSDLADRFKAACDKQKRSVTKNMTWNRTLHIYRELAAAFGTDKASVGTIWNNHVDGDYEGILKDILEIPHVFVYPRPLVRKTILSWLVGTSDITTTSLWTFFTRKVSSGVVAPHVCFTTKPNDIWVMMFMDLSHVTELNPRVVIPTGDDFRDIAILSAEIYVKETSYG